MASLSSAPDAPATTPGPRVGAQVVLRPIGTALPLGMAGLAIASLVLTGLELGWVARVQAQSAGVLVLATAVPLQALACVSALAARDGATASVLGMLAVGWLGEGLTLVLDGARTSDALGLALLAAGVLIAGSAAAVALSKPLPALVFALSGVRFALTGVHHLTGGSAWENVAGALGIAVVLCATYAVWAYELEAAQGARVLPTLRRGKGALALEAPLERQLAEVAHEPGVRRRL